MNQQNNYNFLIQKKNISENDYYNINQNNKNDYIPQIIIPSDSPYETPPVFYTNNQNINNNNNDLNYNNNNIYNNNNYNNNINQDIYYNSSNNNNNYNNNSQNNLNEIEIENYQNKQKEKFIEEKIKQKAIKEYKNNLYKSQYDEIYNEIKREIYNNIRDEIIKRKNKEIEYQLKLIDYSTQKKLENFEQKTYLNLKDEANINKENIISEKCVELEEKYKNELNILKEKIKKELILKYENKKNEFINELENVEKKLNVQKENEKKKINEFNKLNNEYIKLKKIQEVKNNELNLILNNIQENENKFKTISTSKRKLYKKNKKNNSVHLQKNYNLSGYSNNFYDFANNSQKNLKNINLDLFKFNHDLKLKNSFVNSIKNNIN